MIEYVDRPPPGWFALEVMRTGAGNTWDWAALMIDVDPDELERLSGPIGRQVHERWLRIPGKHKNRDAAWEALENMIATRH